ncbi:MAG: metalloregulator ArsR/SmtB family transcription factor [Armatimonadetes bacterium]|nr:metalloregulator ArsR/SmtB family transcription factor [Armatimonadota bacterium]
MSTDTLSLTFFALADPTRRRILSRLIKGPATVMELASPFEMSQPAVTKHLKVLERAGLIKRGKKAQYRPCELNAEPLQTASAWIMDYRTFWEESFDRLDAYLQELQTQESEDES